MRSRAWRGAAALLVAAALSGCSGPAEPAADDAPDQARLAEACADAVDQVVGTTQRYVDSFAADEPAGGQPEGLTDAQYVDAVAGLRTFAASSGCDEKQFADAVSRGLAGVRAETPLARAVLLQLEAGDPTGPPRTVDAAPGDDLQRVAATLPTGSTITLAAGEHALDGPLVLLRGITLRGTSRDTTVLSASAEDGVLLVLTDEAATVADLELRRTGDAPGAVVVAGPVARLTVTGTRVTGGRAGADGAGGAGILMAPAPDGAPDPGTGTARPTTLTVTDSELVGNQSAGVVVAGSHRAQVASSTITGAGQCGVCFLDRSDGVLDRTTLADNVVGVVSVGTSRPVVSGSTVRGGEVSVQVGERGAPVVTGNELAGAARAAVIAGDDATGRVEGNTCREVQVGIVVGGAAVPFLGENAGCQVARGQ